MIMISIAVILVLAAAALTAGAFFAKEDRYGNDPTVWYALGAGGALLVALVFTFFAFTVQVDEGEVILPVVFGEAKAPITEPGIKIINPFADPVSMPIRTVEVTFSSSQEDIQLGPISALSSEGGDVTTDLTVLYHIDPTMADTVYRTVGTTWEEVLIKPTVRSSVRDCVPLFDIEEARTAKRGEAAACILERMQTLGRRGIVIEEVLLRSMDVSPELQAAINQKLEAQNDVQEAEFREAEAIVKARTLQVDRQAEADAQIIDATAAAERVRIAAEAEAQAIEIRAQAEADANRTIAASLLNDQVFQLRVIEGLDLGSKTTILSLEDIAPFLNLGSATP